MCMAKTASEGDGLGCRQRFVMKPSLDDLWLATAAPGRIWRPGERALLPEPARRYLEHAIAPGTTLAAAVRLRMHGEIKLTRWAPFRAEQVIAWNRGMVWTATVRMSGLPVRGYDRLVNGRGEMRWRLLGLIPVMAASGPDITRSAAGRVLTEAVWLPSVLAAEEVKWTADVASEPRARLSTNGDAADLALTIDGQGGLQAVALLRWGKSRRRTVQVRPVRRGGGGGPPVRRLYDPVAAARRMVHRDRPIRAGRRVLPCHGG